MLLSKQLDLLYLLRCVTQIDGAVDAALQQVRERRGNRAFLPLINFRQAASGTNHQIHNLPQWLAAVTTQTPNVVCRSPPYQPAHQKQSGDNWLLSWDRVGMIYTRV